MPTYALACSGSPAGATAVSFRRNDLLAGSGGGGCIIAAVEGGEMAETVRRAVEEAGGEAFVAEVCA